MIIKTFAAVLSTLILFAAANAQISGVQVAMLDGSVRNTTQVDVEFPVASDPGRARVRIGRLPASTLEECMASTDFSGTVAMSPRDYFFSYDRETGIAGFSFGVEREMKEGPSLRMDSLNCQVVQLQFDTDVDGRDFLIWQKNMGVVSGLSRFSGDLNAAAAALGDGSVRFIRESISQRY